MSRKPKTCARLARRRSRSRSRIETFPINYLKQKQSKTTHHCFLLTACSSPSSPSPTPSHRASIVVSDADASRVRAALWRSLPKRCNPSWRREIRPHFHSLSPRQRLTANAVRFKCPAFKRRDVSVGGVVHVRPTHARISAKADGHAIKIQVIL